MVEIRTIPLDDINQVVDIHMSAFKGFFLTDLGPIFLKLYYRSFARSKVALLKGCYEQDKLLAFSASAIVAKGFHKKLLIAYFFSFFIFGVRFFFTDIKILARLLKNVSKKNAAVYDDGDYAELFSIAVDVEQQGKGLGKKLLLQLESDLKSKDVVKVSLTTDCHNNKKTVNFYKGMGYDVFYNFVAYPNREMYRMIKRITKE